MALYFESRAPKGEDLRIWFDVQLFLCNRNTFSQIKCMLTSAVERNPFHIAIALIESVYLSVTVYVLQSDG